MNASEVLNTYEAGERDFRRLNLRGQFFVGKNLSGANFSECDIRGAKFTGANLRGASFRGAKAGLQKRWSAFLLIVSWLLSGILGLLAVLTGTFVALIFNTPGLEHQILGASILIILVLFSVFTIFFGTVTGLGVLAGAGAITIAIAVAVIRTFVLAFGKVAAAGAIAGVGSLIGAIAIAGAGTVMGAIATAIATVIAIASTVAGGFALTFTGIVEVTDIVKAGAIAIALVLFTAYIAWQALKGNEKYALIRNVAIAFATIGGTSFRGANLTDADLSGAKLKSTDFRDLRKQPTKLIRTCWRDAKILYTIRPGKTYLWNPQIQELLTTLQGQNKNFDRCELRGVNLQGANLADASLVGADLREASLANADLSRAKLVETSLDRADLTGATLTGAYIEDCRITSHTKLNGVKCKYVFMRVPTPEEPNPHRKPDRWEEEFEEGEFADFIQPTADTLDLYHHQDIDPRAIAISFEQLAENNPQAQIEIVAIQKRSRNKFLLKARIAPNADSSKLSNEYFATYNRVKTLTEPEVKRLSREDYSRVLSLENMIATFLDRSGFSLEK